MSRNILILLRQAGRLDEFIDDFFPKKEIHGLRVQEITYCGRSDVQAGEHSDMRAGARDFAGSIVIAKGQGV